MPNSQLHQSLHLALFPAISAADATVVLCSPYVTIEIADRLAGLAKRSRAHWRLLTDLNPRAVAYGSLRVDGLRRLRASGVDLHHLAGVHAKVFVVDRSVGFVGSANLTSSGLGTGLSSNVELTIALSARDSRAAASTLDSWHAAATRITAAMLTQCEDDARAMRIVLPPPRRGTPTGLVSTAQANRILDASVHANVWIKGVYGRKVSADVAMGRGAWVSSPKKGRPSFAVGDQLVMYYVGLGVCNGIVEVTDVSRLDEAQQIADGTSAADAARWPWLTPVRQLVHVKAVNGVPIERLGLTGQSVQNGHCRMPVGGLTTFFRDLAGSG